MRKFFILLLVSLFSLASPVHAEVDFSNKTITSDNIAYVHAYTHAYTKRHVESSFWKWTGSN